MSREEDKSTGRAQGLGHLLVRYGDWLMAIGVLGLMVTLITPVPDGVLDILLALNITASLLLLLVTMNIQRGIELSTFPTILLFTTLFRLGLNVASTRIILSGGDVGAVITSFGRYVVGDDLMVGLVVFLVLIVIQFVVITKGAGRISEVAARFVLDAMPGKQMAIDADLNAGIIDSDEARARREEISAEAEFYGSMDGASKFVRGDAIAGLIITSLNLVGGIAIGSMNDLGLGEAVQRYSILTIGDGLVTQIPALLVSTASAVLVTKATGERSLGVNLLAQVGGRPKATVIAAGMMFLMGLLPGMPATPFFVLASALVVLWRATRDAEGADGGLLPGRRSARPAAAGGDGERDAPAADAPDPLEELLAVDRLSLEIGYRLIPLVSDGQGSGILDHIAQLRRRFASNDGLLLPPVRIKDNVRLEPNAYRVLLGGQEIARGEVHPGRLLAMDGGSVSGPVKGQATTDPAFGLPAWWIREKQRDNAELLGYTVIDPTSVLVTHLSEVLAQSFPDLLSRDDVKELVETAKKTSPAVVEELVPAKMSYGQVQAVLRNLLREGVPVRNMPAILETLADHAGRIDDSETLTELVRQRLARMLCDRHADKKGVVHAVTLDPDVEARLASAVGGGEGQAGALPVSPSYLQQLMEKLAEALAAASRGGKDVVVLARSNVRRFLSELVRASLPKVAVLSYNEVVPAKGVETASIVRLDE